MARARELQRLADVVRRPPYGPGLVVVVLAVLLGSLFVASYSLALGRPKPREIPTALVVSGIRADPALIRQIEHAAGSALNLHAYPSEAAARQAIASRASSPCSSPRDGVVRRHPSRERVHRSTPAHLPITLDAKTSGRR